MYLGSGFGQERTGVMANGNNSHGIGFFGALAILFIGLKLGGLIDWSWWWVLAPIWLTPIVVVAIAVTIMVVARSILWTIGERNE